MCSGVRLRLKEVSSKSGGAEAGNAQWELNERLSGSDFCGALPALAALAALALAAAAAPSSGFTPAAS